MDTIPRLTGEALKAVKHRGSPLQIVASAGSGKTEVVSQRVADLFADGVDPDAVVAFTFTEKAAEELKQRIERRVATRLGNDFVDHLNGCYIGTIHAYCYRLLQEHVATYETYDILDQHRLAAFLSRFANDLGIKDLAGQLFRSIPEFMRNVDVVDNELISINDLHDPFKGTLVNLRERLRTHRFLTYGQLIALAVIELKKPRVFEAVHGRLKHLIVDEYQDINPAQEALIKRLAKPPVELCVVGDDDQSIYQWRGSNVANIVTFKRRHKKVATFRLLKNRRSRPHIIRAANKFGAMIEGRMDKSMRTHRPDAKPELVTWTMPTEAGEAAVIARTILRLRRKGYGFRDIAILVRSSRSYDCLIKAFGEHDIPVQPAGRTGLFREPDAQTFGRTFAYLAGHEWRSEQYGDGASVTINDIVLDYTRKFQLKRQRQRVVLEHLESWKAEVENPTKPVDLVGEYYSLLADCGVARWDFDDPAIVARLGCLARCSAILADYESVRRRMRPDADNPGEAIGGQDRGAWYHRWLAIHIQNWALGRFEGFEGEDNFTLDAVDLTTVHKAKGLEWPIVFVPCVSSRRFPASKTGYAQTWHVPEGLFSRSRYEGSINDERRLFYVAMTRARDWLSISTHDTPNVQTVAPSDFLLSVAGGVPPRRDKLPLPPRPSGNEVPEDMRSITFSELADFETCGLSYRLRTLIGFQPSLAPELGYGVAVHHILRSVAEHTQRRGNPPSPDEIDRIFDAEFYLPAASKTGYRRLRSAAKRLVRKYVRGYGEELKDVWAMERPFELHLRNATVSGRADMILDSGKGGHPALILVDYKTATNGVDEDDRYERQLQLYADAARREGLNVLVAYIHDLDTGDRLEVDISTAKLGETEAEIVSLIDRIHERKFEPQPGPACRRCDVRPICRFARK